MRAGAYVCVCRKRGVASAAGGGGTGLGVGMPGFSLPHVSPMTLELNLPKLQLSQLQNGVAKKLLHRVVKKIQTCGCEWAPKDTA